jgi:hypothetical protein
LKVPKRAGIPGFLLGPVIFDGVSWTAISTLQIVSSLAGALFGVWLLIVSCAAEAEVVEEVVTSFSGAEAVLLYLPFMLWIGTLSVVRRARGRIS